MKPKCDTCVHANVCKNRKTFEEMLKDETVMAGLNRVNTLVDWISVEVKCLDHSPDLGFFSFGSSRDSKTSEPEPEEKKSAVDIFKNMLFGGSKDD